MQDFGSGDTSSNLVGGIWTKVRICQQLFFPGSIIVLVYTCLNSYVILSFSNYQTRLPAVNTCCQIRYPPVVFARFRAEDDASLYPQFVTGFAASGHFLAPMILLCLKRTMKIVSFRSFHAVYTARYTTPSCLPQQCSDHVAEAGRSAWRSGYLPASSIARTRKDNG